MTLVRVTITEYWSCARPCSKSFLGLISFNSPITQTQEPLLLSLNDKETETQEVQRFAEGLVAGKEWSWGLKLAVFLQSSPSDLSVPLGSYRSSGNGFTSLENKQVSSSFAILRFWSSDMASLEHHPLPREEECTVLHITQLRSHLVGFLVWGMLDSLSPS